METRVNRPHTLHFWLLTALILGIAAWLRWHQLLAMPLWWDEGLHITRMHAALDGRIFEGLERNKWLYQPLVALLRPAGPEGPFLARSVNVLLGVLSAAVCLRLSLMVGGRRASLLAGLIYALLPMAVFHERQAIFDPLLGALAGLSALLSILLVHSRRPWLVIPLLGAALAAAVLTRILGLPALVLPLAAVVLLRGPQPWLSRLGHAGLALALAGAIIGGVYTLARQQGVRPIGDYQASIENTLFTSLETEASDHLHTDITQYGEMLLHYFVGIIPAAAVYGAASWLGGRTGTDRKRLVLFLLIPLAAFTLAPWLAERPSLGGRLAPRYLLPMAIPLSVLAALGLRRLLSAPRGRSAARLAAGAALAAFAALALRFDVLLHGATYRAAPLVSGDAQVYFTPANQHEALRQAIPGLLSLWHANGTQPIGVITTGDTPFLLAAYTGPRVAAVGDSAWLIKDDPPEQIAGWLGQGRPVYLFMDNLGQLTTADYQALGISTRLVQEQRAPLYQITGFEGDLAYQVYANAAPDPARMGADYDALAEALNASGETGPVLIYPNQQERGLWQRTPRAALRILPGVWPITPQAADEALARLPLQPEPARRVDVVLVDEARSDPQRVLALALNERLYRLRENWYGLLHHEIYMTGPQQPAFQEVNAVFEGAISLRQAAVVDTAVSPGGAVRLALSWQTNSPIQDEYSIFVHLIDAEGRLTAQADGQPGGGLLPMTAWVPGEVITDKLALSVPADAPPGQYVVQVGIYLPANGLRLRLTEGPGGPDYAAVGQVSVE